MKKLVHYINLNGSLSAPSSKSSMQRAIVCSLLSYGKSILIKPSFSADCQAALGLAKDLGAIIEVDKKNNAITIEGIISKNKKGINLRGIAKQTNYKLNCAESGLCMRMFSAVVALFDREFCLEAYGSLKSRSMAMLELPLKSLGVKFESNNGLPPLKICGPLKYSNIEVDASKSSQFITGLLMSLPLVSGNSSITSNNLVSRGYLDLSLATMKSFGVKVKKNIAGTKFSIKGSQVYKPSKFSIEGDWSGAAFLLVASALDLTSNGFWVNNLQADSTQPDRAIIKVLRKAGARVFIYGSKIKVTAKNLKAFKFNAMDCPDLFPPLAVLASFCEGLTELEGLSRLRDKESDRAFALKELLSNIGILSNTNDNSLFINGSYNRIVDTDIELDSFNDHRIAMAISIFSCRSKKGLTISNPNCVSKSWPDFFDVLNTAQKNKT